MRARHVLVTLAGAALLSACFRTTVRSGQPPWHSPASHYEKWHSGYVLGAAEASGPYELTEVCPDGWSEVETETDPFEAYLTVLTLGIYAPQSVTIACTAPGAPNVPPKTGFDPSTTKGDAGFPPAAPPASDF